MYCASKERFDLENKLIKLYKASRIFFGIKFNKSNLKIQFGGKIIQFTHIYLYIYLLENFM